MRWGVVSNQNSYSIFDRTIENNGLKHAAKDFKKGIIAFSPLAQGLLTDKYLNGIPKDSRVVTDGRFLSSERVQKCMNAIVALNELAKKRGEKLSKMALSWILKDDVVTSVLVGASKPEQLLENIQIVNRTPFSDEEVQLIDKIVEENL